MLKLDKELCHDMLHRMLRVRAFEERVTVMVDTGEMNGSAHTGIGEEGVYVGACAALNNDDTIVGTHRSHGHPIAKGADLKGLMAELFGKEAGVNHGMGGSMHLADSSVGSLGESAMVGSGPPIACGAALAYKLRKEKKVCAVFFGDGAAHEGTIHESMNIASVMKLPVIFVLENNGNVTSHNTDDIHSVKDFAVRAAGYNMPGVSVDGQQVEKVYEAMTEAVARARAGFGPTLLDCKTRYFHPHGEGAYLRMLQPQFRDMEELESFAAMRDPIKLFEKKLLKEQVMDQAEIDALHELAYREVDEAYQYGKECPYPETDISVAYKYLYSTKLDV